MLNNTNLRMTIAKLKYILIHMKCLSVEEPTNKFKCYRKCLIVLSLYSVSVSASYNVSSCCVFRITLQRGPNHGKFTARDAKVTIVVVHSRLQIMLNQQKGSKDMHEATTELLSMRSHSASILRIKHAVGLHFLGKFRQDKFFFLIFKYKN